MLVGRQRTHRWAALALLGSVLVVAPASAAGDPAASLYQPDSVGVIKLELPPKAIEALQADPEGDYQTGTFSFAETDGTPSGVGEFSTPRLVSVRLKGSGSFRPLGQKAAFKLKFKAADAFLGLRKMTLNNMVQDTSMVHERLAYEVFEAMGVPHSRTSFADVILNGVDYGVHLNIEALDKVALEERFGPFQSPPQHLYEGEYNADVTPGRVGLLEVDEGDEANRSDLDALVAAVNAPSPPDWSDSVAPYANLVEMTMMWAAEKYMGHVDGYSAGDRENIPNNFYLYSDPSGRFQMLPWGTDQTWFFKEGFTASSGVLFDRCIGDTSCNAMYRAATQAGLEAIPALGLETVARCTAQLLKPWQAQEPAAMQPHSASSIASAVTATRSWISRRPGDVAAFLGVPAPSPPPPGLCPGEPEPEPEEPKEETPKDGGGDPPKPPGDTGGDPLLPASTPLPGSVAAPPVREFAPARRYLRLQRSWLSGQALQLRIKAPAAGSLALDVRRGDSGRGPLACSVRRVIPAGVTPVSCPFNAATRRTLAARSQRFTVNAVLRTTSGLSFELPRAVQLPRP